MLNHYIVQVDPAGQSGGTFTFKLWAKGNNNLNSPDCTFSVPFNSNSDTLHAAIADGLNGTNPTSCVGLQLVANKKTLKDDSDFAGAVGPNPRLPLGDSSDNINSPGVPIYNSGPYVVIENAGAKLQNVQVASSNQATFVRAETSNKALIGNPTLSPWGVALLALMILISSLWFFRKRAAVHPD
jgi:hypothetical protein